MLSASPPKFSIITPSFNQSIYLEDALRSVIEQDYTNKEYLVIDGGSSDGSGEILESYSSYLSYWCSEPDKGQSDGINKGLALATGDIIAWLNSDDMLVPGTLARVAAEFQHDPSLDVVVGHSQFIDIQGGRLDVYPCEDRSLTQLAEYWRGWPIPQPSVFFSRRVLEKVGVLNEQLHYVLDMDLFLRMRSVGKFLFLNEVLSYYRIHDKAKTGDWKSSRYLFWKEADSVVRKYWGSLFMPRYWLNWMLSRLALFRAYRDRKGHACD